MAENRMDTNVFAKTGLPDGGKRRIRAVQFGVQFVYRFDIGWLLFILLVRL